MVRIAVITHEWPRAAGTSGRAQGKDNDDHRIGCTKDARIRARARTGTPTESPRRWPGCARPSPAGAPATSSGASGSCLQLAKLMEENEAAIAGRAGRRSGPQPVRGVHRRHRHHRRRSEVRGQEGAQVDAPQIPAAGDAAAARPRLDRVRALRHRADHRRLELPVLSDAGSGGRGDRRRKRRRSSSPRRSPRRRTADGRAGAAVPRQRRDRGGRGRRRGEPGADRAGPGPGACSPAAPRSAARCTRVRPRI